jgi:hypothetical protein
LDYINLYRVLNHDYGVSTNDVIPSTPKITIPFNANFKQIKKDIVRLNQIKMEK